MQDLDSWERVGVKHVLAIDVDPESVQRAKQKLETRSKRTSKTQVTLHLADLSVPASLPAIEQVDTVLCHFAIHHFWTSDATKNVFKQNLLPHLRPGGHFVVTYMNADALQGKCVVGNSKEQVDFETNNVSETNMLAESIGINQAESLVYHDDLVVTMKGNGMSLEADMSFEELRSLVDAEYSLSAEEVRFSNLYRAAVFQAPKREMRCSSVDVLFHRPLFFQVLSFLDDVKSIVRLRRVHSWFRGAIDSNESKEYRSAKPKLIYSRAMEKMEPCTVACFLRLGGEVGDSRYDAHVQQQIFDRCMRWRVFKLM